MADSVLAPQQSRQSRNAGLDLTRFNGRVTQSHGVRRRPGTTKKDGSRLKHDALFQRPDGQLLGVDTSRKLDPQSRATAG